MLKKTYYSTGWPDDDPERETDGIDLEEEHYIPDDAINNNLEIFTPRRTILVKDRYSGQRVAIIDVNDDGEEKERFCPHCLSHGFKNKLGAKIKKKGERPAVDDDKFTSCYECGNTFPLHDTTVEKTLKSETDKHTTSNPFEAFESIIMSVGPRKLKNNRLDKYVEDEDPDIAREQRSVGSENVRIIKK